MNKQISTLTLEDCVKLEQKAREEGERQAEEAAVARLEEIEKGVRQLFNRIGLEPKRVKEWEAVFDYDGIEVTFQVRRYNGMNQYVPEYYVALEVGICPDCGGKLHSQEYHLGHSPEVIGQLLLNPEPKKHVGCNEENESFGRGMESIPLHPTPDEKLMEAFKEWLRGWERSEYNDD